MTFHDHRTPLPAAVPPAARGLPGLEKRAERERIRTFIADRIEAMIALMDRLDGDPDLEDGADREEEDEHGGDIQDERHDEEPDREPSLGSLGGTATGIHSTSQHSWAGGSQSDCEEENEHGGDIQDEPHDEDADREPSLCGITVSAPSAGGDDREFVNEDGTEAVKPAKPRARKPKAAEPTVEEYLLDVKGDCCAPVFPDGSQILCTTEPPIVDGFVAIHFTPATAKRIGVDAWLKRLLFMTAPERGRHSNVVPCVCVEQLNPPRRYTIPWSDIASVHRVIGLKPAEVRGVKMKAADKARFHRTWVRGVRVERSAPTGA